MANEIPATVAMHNTQIQPPMRCARCPLRAYNSHAPRAIAMLAANHYFEDRETILATLVVEGFDELARRLAAANDLAPIEGVRAALIASGRTYVDFALSQPGVFRVMFRPDACNPLRFPAVLEAGMRARAELDRLNQIAHGAAANPAQASILWAYVHGLACLLIDGPLAMAFETQDQREHHLDEVANAFANMLLTPQDEAISNLGHHRKDGTGLIAKDRSGRDAP